MNMTEQDKKWVKVQMLNLTGFVIMLFAVSLAATYSPTAIVPVWGIVSFLVLGAVAMMASSIKEYQIMKNEAEKRLDAPLKSPTLRNK